MQENMRVPVPDHKTPHPLSFWATIMASIFLLLGFNILIIFAGSADAATFYIQNNCSYTVWAAAAPGGGTQLDSGQTWVLDIEASTNVGRLWGRTRCQFDDTGNGRCQTGDCGGLLRCNAYGSSPNTIVEYSLNQFQNMDFFDISFLDGFNVPVEFSSVSGSCNRVIKCAAANIVDDCPDEIRAPGGCNGPCPGANTSAGCCTTGNCGPNYSLFYKERCPDAYSYSTDDKRSQVTCPGGTDYKLVFCPSS